MASEPTAASAHLGDDFEGLLASVRRVDPSCDADAVRRYMQEIADADAVLRDVELRESVPVVEFDPRWPGEQAQR